MREGREMQRPPQVEHAETEKLSIEIARLWKWYRFPKVNIPKPGGEAEQRLFAYAKDYLSECLHPNSDIRISERTRRALHNQLAVMVLGEFRTNLSDDQADEIANFASELVYGVKLEELYDLQQLEVVEE